jgi:hemerythrin-like domain-containing protein
MRTIQTLACEHESIASILARFERSLDEAERSLEIDRATFERLLEFFERSVDGQHQEKEERILLPCLARRATDQAAPDVIQVLVRYGRLYLLRERKHARWEETALFPLATRILTPEDDREILQGFEHIDAHWESNLPEEARRLSAWIDRQGAAIHPV